MVNLAGNNFSGPLDTNWSKLSLLRCMDLSNNLFSGTLPPSWAGLRPVGTLGITVNVSYNPAVNGSLPSAWGLAGTDAQYMRLDTLDATNCSLSGTTTNVGIQSMLVGDPLAADRMHAEMLTNICLQNLVQPLLLLLPTTTAWCAGVHALATKPACC